jgi:hypothetical protein
MAGGTHEECLAVFRQVRDGVKARVEQFVASTTAIEQTSGS